MEKEVGSLRFGLRNLATARPGSRAADGMAQVWRPWRSGSTRCCSSRSTSRTGRSCSCRRARCTRCRGRCCRASRSGRWRSRRRCGSGTARRRSRNRPDPQQVFVAGPRLPAATEEVEALAQRHPQALTLTRERRDRGQRGAGARRRGLGAHRRARPVPGRQPVVLQPGARGRERSPSTTSSACARCPQRIVLSSCESGLSAVHAGDELMGFTAALFALGTCTIYRRGRAGPGRGHEGPDAGAGRRVDAAARNPRRRW